MAMTLTEKILARAAGRDTVAPGENVWVDVDVLMTHDVCGPATFGIFQQEFGPEAKVWDPEKLVVIPDHYVFTSDEKAQRNIETLREFAARQKLPHFYDVGTDRYRGVCHLALAETGHTRPGEVLFGTDSHTCTAGAFGQFATGIGNTEAAFILGTGKLWVKVPETMRFVFDGDVPAGVMAKDLILTVLGEIGTDGATYRAMEFVGPGVAGLNMEERMTLCNMAVEAGGKNGIIPPDAVTLDYVAAHNAGGKPFEALQGDTDAPVHSTHTFDGGKLEPMVARPHSPDNTAPARELSDTPIDRAYVGSCTGGKTVDMLAAATILAGRKAAVDTFVVPATREVETALDTERLGDQTLREVFIAAGATIGPPSCAACLGGPVDTFGRLNEPLACISSTNRNFPGRMGHKQGQVFLASPLTVAASAVTGKITDPRELMR